MHILSQNKKNTKTLIGHGSSNKHKHQIGLVEEIMCQFCPNKEKTAMHVLSYFEVLAPMRFLIFRKEIPRPIFYTREFTRKGQARPDTYYNRRINGFPL